MMLRVFVVALGLVPAIALAQSPQGAPILSSSVTLGWTSNAEGAPGGTSDIFVRHSHKLGFADSGDDYALRGSLTLGETRYNRLWQENDREIGLDLAGEWRVAPETSARLNFILGYNEEGQAITLGTDLVGATTPILRGSLGVEVESQLGSTLVVAGLNYGSLIHGDTWFSALANPQRMRADTGTLSGDIRLVQPLSETLAMTGLVRGLVQSTSSGDQAFYGRIPARVLRLAAGIEAKIPLRAAFSLEAGADIVWTEVAGHGVAILPYARSEMMLALGGGFDFSTSLRTSLDLETPADGYADWKIKGRAAIGYAIAQTVRLEAAILASATRSIAFDIEHKSQLGGEISVETTFGNAFSGRASLRHTKNTRFSDAFDETRLGVTLAATI